MISTPLFLCTVHHSVLFMLFAVPVSSGAPFWGHVVSKDLAHWTWLPPALMPDTQYDFNGVWSGAATMADGDLPILTFTGTTAQRLGMLIRSATAAAGCIFSAVVVAAGPVSAPPGVTVDTCSIQRLLVPGWQSCGLQTGLWVADWPVAMHSNWLCCAVLCCAVLCCAVLCCPCSCQH
jgi:hypothetical protein